MPTYYDQIYHILSKSSLPGKQADELATLMMCNKRLTIAKLVELVIVAKDALESERTAAEREQQAVNLRGRAALLRAQYGGE